MKKQKLSNAVIILILSVAALCFVLPFVIVISTSLSNEKQILIEGCGLLPRDFDLSTYKYIFDNPIQIINAYKTTIIVTVIGTALSMLFQSGIAYCIARPDFLWKRQLSFFVYFTMLFSGGLVPSYILITQFLHLKDTIWAIILPMLCGGWNIFLLRTHFQTMPFSLIEAAKIDGGGEYFIFFKIAMPIVKTGIATVTLFVMMGYWNEWYLSMLYISKDEIVTLQYLLTRMLNDVSFMNKANEVVGGSAGVGSSSTIPLRMATCILAAGPMLLGFPFVQKYFVKGVTVGSVKG